MWDRVLSASHISAWISCASEASQAEGNIISWETVWARLNISGLNTREIQRAETCWRDTARQRKYLAFSASKTFSQTVQFCRGLGGEMAVARDERTLDLMKEAFSAVGPASIYFYSGYQLVSGQWVDVNTGDLST